MDDHRRRVDALRRVAKRHDWPHLVSLRQTRSVELATIGRRVCETEWDLLNLLDKPVAHAG